MSSFQGMRWFKCDFQIQSPEDGSHWIDADTRLSEPRRPLSASGKDALGKIGPSIPDETGIQAVARRFLQRCHEVGLEVIAITDHNFSQKSEPRDWFLTHLVEQNKSVAKDICRPPLTIFPGFEVDIGYHVLCLFEPATKQLHVRRIHMLLAKLGLTESQRFRGGRPEPLRASGAMLSLKRLLEVVQSEHGGIVIAAHADQTDGILTHPRNLGDYQNPELLAVEITSSPPAARYHDILSGANREWSRPFRQPAYVMSSDAKSLAVDDEGCPRPNSVGYRHTWVKMSKPSIEALRQAFLDPQSRLRVLGNRPSDTQKHPRIKQLEVRNARFLADQTVQFSDGLNCVIGGRGSGKSSLLEYLRFALEINETATSKDAFTDRKRQQLLDSIAEGEIRVTFEVEGGVSDTIVYTPSQSQQRHILGREVSDLSTVLKHLQVQFFSQGELSRMTGGTGGQAQVLGLISKSSGRALIETEVIERDLQSKLRILFQAERDVSRLAEEIRIAQQELVELDRQLSARVAVQADSTRNQHALLAARYLEELIRISGRDIREISEAAKRLQGAECTLPEKFEQWPSSGWFRSTTDDINEARADFLRGLKVALDAYEAHLAKRLDRVATADVTASIAAAQEKFREACAAKGVNPSDIARLQELEASRQDVIQAIGQREQEWASVARTASEFPKVLSELHGVWRRQFSIRHATSQLMAAAVASQTIRISTEYLGDMGSFLAIWSRLSPRDGRARLARRWDEVGQALFSLWKTRSSEPSPWETLQAVRAGSVTLVVSEESSEALRAALANHLDSEDVRAIWEAVRITRIKDGVDVELLRDDGSVAGTMSGTLSEGQRNTVLLNLMLARGIGPIVIDQPEDELDSSFIFKTLVRDLRAARQRRQLVIATHNANLPVNGDADLIYALEARDGRGQVTCEGGLDRKEITEAVLEVMEGSEKAFKRRSEKYHF